MWVLVKKCDEISEYDFLLFVWETVTLLDQTDINLLHKSDLIQRRGDRCINIRRYNNTAKTGK